LFLYVLDGFGHGDHLSTVPATAVERAEVRTAPREQKRCA
jgi:hypothetical protein